MAVQALVCRKAWQRHSRAAGSSCRRCATLRSAAAACSRKVDDAFRVAISLLATCFNSSEPRCIQGPSISTCLSYCHPLSAVANELRSHVPHEAACVGVLECLRTLSAYISARAFSFADAVSWNGDGLCVPGRDGDGISFAAASGATDGRLTVARVWCNEPFEVMLGVPFLHGVVRWELLLHRGTGLAIGCTAWPVVGAGPRYDIEMKLKNSWMWLPYVPEVLIRGASGPAAASRWPAVLADGCECAVAAGCY